MLIVISPAKTLDFERPMPASVRGTRPDHIAEASQIMAKLQAKSVPGLAKLMDISATLADLNFHRFARWQADHSGVELRPAILAFRGDVYQGLDADSFSSEDLAHAQQHLRILSGLYGVLRPLDMIQPYRLEMGTRLTVGRKKNLYQFWGKRIAENLNQVLMEQGDNVLVNLASDEYYDAVDLKALKARVIKPVFMDRKNGRYKVISFYAKKARGMMSAYILQNRIQSPEGLKGFGGGGYVFESEMSKADEWVFVREAPETAQ